MVERLRLAHEDLRNVELMLIEAESDVEALSERNRAVKQQLDDLQKEYDRLVKVTEDSRVEAAKNLKIVKRILEHVEPAEREFFSTTVNHTPEQLEEEIDSEKARLDLIVEGNDGVIREFEKREREIEKLKGRVADVQHSLAEISDQVKRIRALWEPKLEKLIARISESFGHNMKEINCAGEVGIFKDEDDYDQWAIQIKVKFRYVSFYANPFPSMRINTTQ